MTKIVLGFFFLLSTLSIMTELSEKKKMLIWFKNVSSVKKLQIS